MLFQLHAFIESSSAQWYLLEGHQEGQSPYLYKYTDVDTYWFNSYLLISLGEQTETQNINKYSYTCNELNSNSFMSCMENYYSKKLGCLLPWSLQKSPTNVTVNACKGRDKFIEFKNLSMNILKPEKEEELIKEGCFTPNCGKRSWKMKFKQNFPDKRLGFTLMIRQNTKVVVRKEVNLYTPINFFAEVGGYLGLLLGESMISYIVMVSQKIHFLARELKARCGKKEETK